MDKKDIKKHLIERFVKESSTPGISMAKKMKKIEDKINKDGVKAIEKDVASSEKEAKEDINTKEMAQNKFNYTDKNEADYHKEMEIMNGQEMVQYDREPSETFKDRALEAIEGSSKMGNNPEWANVIPAQQGFTGPDFGKKLAKEIKASVKKRNEQTPTLNLRGRDIQADVKDTGNRPYAIQENKDAENVEENKINTPKIKESMKRLKFNKEFEGSNTTQKLGHALTLIPESYKTDNKEFEMTDGNVTCRVRWEGNLTEGKAVILSAKNKALVNEDIDRMKALFNYKSESTLGLVKGKARLDENVAFADVYSKTKKLMDESEDIEGTTAEVIEPADSTKPHAPEAKKHVKGSVKKEKEMADVKEPKEAPFEEAETGKIEESEKIEGAKAKTVEPADSSKPHAPEAKKHVKGSVSQKKDGTAPQAKEGDPTGDGVKQAKEAKKHVEGSVPTDKKTEAKKPKEAPFEEAEVGQAPEAKEHIEDKKGKKLAKKAPVVKENEEMDADDNGEEPEDTWNKPDMDDDSSDEAEPTATDIKSEPVPAPVASDDEDDVAIPAKAGAAKLMKSKSTGKFFILVGTKPVPCPDHLVALAKKNAQAALDKMAEEEEAAEMAGGEEDMDEGFFSADVDQAKKTEILKQLEAYAAQGLNVNKEKIMDQAKADGFTGKLVVKAGKNNPNIKIVQYIENPQGYSSARKIGSGTGSQTLGK